MHCCNCNANNIDCVNFCYKCGQSFSKDKSGINGSHLSDNICIEKAFSLERLTCDNIVFSKNKHRNIFILLSIIVLCSALSVPLCKGLPESFSFAITLVNTPIGYLSKEFLKSQTELFFRDVFVRILLLLSFCCLILFNIMILFYTYILNRRKMKTYKK